MTIEFSINGFHRLLDRLTGAGYRTTAFSDVAATASGPVCLLRHDVDASVEFALRMAELEADRGVRATYFFMVRSALYNLFSRQTFEDVRRIVALGHDVGLHFDASHPAAAQAGSIEQQIAGEMALVANVAGRPVTAFSWHQPSADLLSRRVDVPGAVNAYALDSVIEYVSDSNRDWRGRDLAALIDARTSLQILLHPMWWICPDPHVWDCWDAAFLRNFSRQQDWLRATERAFGPRRQFRIVREGANAGERPAGEVAYLSPLTDADSAPLFEWINDRELVVLSAPFRPVHQPDHDAWFRAIRSRKDVVIFGIRRSDDHSLVGSCQLRSINTHDRSAELQIRIGLASATGKGIGTAACRALLRYAFDDLNLQRVYLHVLATNVRARRLYERLGFTTDGIATDAVFIDGQSRDLVHMSMRRP